MTKARMALVLTSFAWVACVEQPAAPISESEIRASIYGEIGPGSSYEILVPPEWNGSLGLYAHGYVDPAGVDPLTPFERALLPALPAMGYAVAYSTFSENGLAVKDGMQRTKQLRGIFAAQVGEPQRTYLVGGSMGGLIALGLSERFPQHYDGVLALCGLVGGSQAQIDYVGHLRVLFDVFYPGVLPGTLFENPNLSPLEVAALVMPAIAGDPTGAGLLANVMAMTFETPIPGGADPALLAESIVTALAFDVRGFADVLDRTHGHVPFDNSDVWYAGTPDDAALNFAVDRYESRPDAARYLRKYYEPTGHLGTPVVTLHNQMDPVAPILHEARLGVNVASAGASEWLVQTEAAAPYGHCAFDEQEVLGKFGSLVAWVELGIPPMTP